MNKLDYLYEQNWQLAVGIIVLGGVRWVATHVLGRTPISQRLPWIVKLANLVIAPLVVVASGNIAHALSAKLGLDSLGNIIGVVTVFAAYMALAWVISRLIELFIQIKQSEKDSRRVPGLFIGLLRTGCLIVGIAGAITHLDYSITGVWVSTSVAVALIGFAVQKTLNDLFSGITLSLERPFELDDWLELSDGTVGQVIDINWRATRLRAWDKATYIIPNGELASQGFKNYHDADHPYAPWYKFRIPAEIDPRFVKILLLEAALRCESIMNQPAPVVRLLDASTIPYTYMIWVHFPNYLAMFSGRDELFREVHLALKSANIKVSPNAQEMYMRKSSAPDAQLPSIKIALKSLDVTGLLDEKDIDQVAASSRFIVIESGKIILEHGTITDHLYIIYSGVVEVSLEVSSGKLKSVGRLEAGEYFGITSMMTDEPQDFRYSALTEVNIIGVDIECIQAILNRRPELEEEVAQMIKQKIESAEEARMAVKNSRRQPTLNEILDRVRKSVRMNPKPDSQ